MFLTVGVRFWIQMIASSAPARSQFSYDQKNCFSATGLCVVSKRSKVCTADRLSVAVVAFLW